MNKEEQHNSKELILDEKSEISAMRSKEPSHKCKIIYKYHNKKFFKSFSDLKSQLQENFELSMNDEAQTKSLNTIHPMPTERTKIYSFEDFGASTSTITDCTSPAGFKPRILRS